VSFSGVSGIEGFYFLIPVDPLQLLQLQF